MKVIFGFIPFDEMDTSFKDFLKLTNTKSFEEIKGMYYSYTKINKG